MDRTRTPAADDPPPASGKAPPPREHAQAIYDRVISWYEDAEKKAQLILTLDGVFVSFLSTSAFKKADDLDEITKHFGVETWVLLGLMAVALVASVVSAVIALRSRLYTKSKLTETFNELGVDPARGETYVPAVAWFFQFLANLEPNELASALLRADADFAVRTLAESVVPLAQNVDRKHRWVNRGFFFFGAVLVFFLAAAVSYVSRAS